MGTFFALTGIGAGVYCLYAYLMMKTKKQLNNTVLLPKGVDARKCLDLDGYIRATALPLLILGLVLLIYGILEMVNAYYMPIQYGVIGGLAAVGAALIWFAVVTKKAYKKYFK